MPPTLGELAELVGGVVKGDASRTVRSVLPLETAGPEDLSFLQNRKYKARAQMSDAGCLLVREADQEEFDRDLIVCKDPYFALSKILPVFDARSDVEPGCHPTAVIDPQARVDETAAVGAYSVVGAGSRIDAGSVLHSHVVIGRDCEVGAGSILHPGVVLYDRTRIGARCVLNSGVVLGGDGFGFATHEGAHHKLCHIGSTILEDDVEVGANSTVDRGLLGDTVVGSGTKIDNHVMLAHNVRIGRNSLLAAQSGIAGSTEIGDGLTLAAQSGIIGHLKVGDGTTVAAKSAVLRKVEAGSTVAGIPAIPMNHWKRQQVLLNKLDELRRRLATLERESAAAGDGGEDT